LKLQLIGTGSAFAKKFNNNNALVFSGGQTLLLDCGITAPRALYELDISFDKIDAVLVSHIHGDHVGGLEELAFQMKYLYKRKPKLFIADSLIAPLWEQTLRGGMQQDEESRLDDYFEVHPLKEEQAVELLPGLTAELLLTRHIPNKPSYSFLFNEEVFYTADMVFSPQLLEQLVKERGVKTIFHDCQLHAPGIVHTCLPELLTLPETIQRRILLMHYGDDQPDFVGKSGFMTFAEQNRVYILD
jgi:ribonuclease BN (tRNA processing enzyme)